MSDKKKTNPRLGTCGGQALIEGIMMNSPNGAAIAVRRADGSIIVKQKRMTRLRDKYKILGIPLVRGVVNFIESMIIGYKSLMESADLSGMLDMEDVEEEEMSKFDKWLERHFGEKMMSIITGVAMVLGVLLAVALFVLLPTYIVAGIDKYLLNGSIGNFKALCEGLIRMAVFIAYLFAVSRMKDIKRTFMYHGAEHKTIFCYEDNKELTNENIRGYKRFHPRCGTSFIFSVMIISILVSSLILVFFEGLKEHNLLWSLIKILIMPLIMGIGYEFIRLAGKYDNPVTRFLASPGIWMQRLTTVEPTDDMLEVAVAALEGALSEEDFGERILNAPEEKEGGNGSILRAELPEDTDDGGDGGDMEP